MFLRGNVFALAPNPSLSVSTSSLATTSSPFIFCDIPVFMRNVSRPGNMLKWVDVI